MSSLFRSMATTMVTDLSPGMSCVEFRKKTKTGVEENHLSANVWEGLPECLIEEVLAKLPFSSLFSFCRVCKRWRDAILSGNPHLAFFHAGKLIVLNPNRNACESVSMSFFPVDRLSSLSLVASAGGLLCFRTRSFDDFIVCNPLTRSCKRVQMPWAEAQTLEPVTRPVRTLAILRNFHRSKSLPRIFLVGMILNSDERHFKLIVASGVSNGERATLVYDSSSDSWEKADGVPEVGEGGFHETRPVPCGGNLFSTVRTTNDEMKLLKFDVQQQTWSRIHVPEMSDLPCKLLEHNGKILLVSGNPRNPAGFAFYELKDSGITSWSSSKSLSLIRLFEAMERSCRVSETLKTLECLGQGDSMFCIGSKFSNSTASRVGLKKLGFTVGVHNFSTNSDIFAGWEEPQIGGCHSFPRLWQIFRPSLLPCVG